MLSREDKLLAELLVRRGVLSSQEIAAAETERAERAPQLSLSDFLVEKGLLDGPAIGQTGTQSIPGRIGEFEIVREIGRGGMGIVYEAIQQPLGRHVALKVLPAIGALHDLQTERFAREARAVARLKHPNIVTIHASGERDGWQFIAMDLVNGPSIEALIDEQGPIDTVRAVTLVRAVADALQSAHDVGLIHRDVKPSNILLDTNDIPKLSDFGLVHDELATRLTLSATVLGTPAFMSPEQARGDDPKPGHDVYALGAVLYAMLAGRPPYEGTLPSAVLSRLLTESPQALCEVRPEVPAAVASVCDRALSRDPRERYSTASDLAEDLTAFLEGRKTNAERRSLSSKRRRFAWSVAGVLGLSGLLGVLAWLVPWPLRGDSRSAAFDASSLRPLRRITASPGPEIYPSLSPDGSWVAYASEADGDWDVYLDRIGEQRPQNLTNDSPQADGEPAFSPDGQQIAFRSEREGGGIFVLEVATRQVRKILNFGHHPSWSPDGARLAVSTELVLGVGRSPRNYESEIWSVNVASGTMSRLVSIDAVQPAWSPAGTRIAFIGQRTGVFGLWTASTDGDDIVLCAESEGLLKDPAWLRAGNGLIVTSRLSGTSDLRAITVDEHSGRCGKDQAAVVRSLAEAQQNPSISGDGRLLALVSWKRSESAFRVATGVGRENAPQSMTGDTRVESAPDLSPDGRWLALSVQDGPSDLVLVRTDNSDRRNLTQDSFEERTPRWSPDGRWIAFAANRSGNFEIWRIRPDGTGAERLTETTDGSALSPVWSPDGSRLVYGVRGLGILEVDPSAPAPRAARIVFPTSRLKDPESVPRAWSPDGRLLLLVDRDRNATLLDLRTGEETTLAGKAQGGAWTGTGELWVTDGSDLKVLDPATGKSRVLATVTPRKFSAALSIDRRTGDAYTTVVENEADIWLMDLTGADRVGAPAAKGR